MVSCYCFRFIFLHYHWRTSIFEHGIVLDAASTLLVIWAFAKSWDMVLTKYDKLYFLILKTHNYFFEGNVVLNGVVVLLVRRQSWLLVGAADSVPVSWHARM